MRGNSFKVAALALIFSGAVLLVLYSVSAWTSLPVSSDQNVFMPGSQPGDTGTFESPAKCDNCHGLYDSAVEPDYNWRGSMMAQAARDPLWLACLTVADQDSIWAVGNPNAGDICIRCHSPTGWLEGRSDPTNTASLTGDDFWGVQCDFCHRMLDPMTELGQPDVPPETPGSQAETLAQSTYNQDVSVLSGLSLFNGTPFLNSSTNLPTYYGDGSFPYYVESGSGQFFVDPTTAKRGPFSDPNAKHQFYYSRYHKSKDFCTTCHDVSNPVLASVVLGNDTPEVSSPQTYFHVERTSSEFMLSAFGEGGAATNGFPNVSFANKCQDCHMRDVTGVGCNKAGTPTRTDLPLHDFTGGNTWMTAILASADQVGAVYDPYNYDILSGTKYAGASVDVTGIQGYASQLSAASDRARGMLQSAANLTVENETANYVTLRVTNNGGHKLISGFPEGRRMFLSIRFYDGSDSLIGEVNPYEPLVTGVDAGGNDTYVSGANLTKTHEELVWEAGLMSSITGEDHSFHFALGTDRWKDNRIPPKGFNTSGMYQRHVQPRWEGEDAPDYFTAEEYAGGYDDVTVTKPEGTAYFDATLYYQTTSKEYIEFLRDEINGVGGTLNGTGAGGDPPYIVQTDPFFDNLRGWGDAIWDLWLHNGGAAPVPMETLNYTAQEQTYYITLEPGLNLISVPFVQSEEAVPEVLAPIFGDYGRVMAYNASNGEDEWEDFTTYGYASMNDLAGLDHAKGFWVDITDPAGVSFAPRGYAPSASPSIVLRPGWNLAGYPSLVSTHNVSTALAGIDYDRVVYFDAAGDRYVVMGPDDLMVRGRGYWIHSTAATDQVWSVPL